MNKIKVEKYLDGKEYEVKVGEFNFEMEFDLKKVLEMVVEEGDDDVDDIIEGYEKCKFIEDLNGEFELSEESFCRIYKDGELVVG